MASRRPPGTIRDAILRYMKNHGGTATVAEIEDGVSQILGEEVSSSSVRSYLGLNTPGTFKRVARGKYKLK